ncbi:helix-turn-helix transcriptional regulator [Marinicrinis lubricantis]|uniref:Helix-turn-helix transcriptional regulator n=1 Tax=Marinicrinis lubricantis TaxID=2086470 RepID=A0ABW1ITV5_9BACL
MKLERLISMIYMLLNNEVISTSALADKYQVSQRTIYRDIDTICAAGIPVVSYQGANGGYGIMESYKMDRSLLGSYDVDTLVTILNSLGTVFTDEQASETIRKLQTIQRDTSGPSLTLDIGSRRASTDSLRMLRTAIKTKRLVSFEYISMKNERVHRDVEPVCLMYKNQNWYLYGYCRLRRDYREFRLNRMTELAVQDMTYHSDHALPVQERKEYSARTDLSFQVVLRFSTQALAKALDFFHDADKQFGVDGSMTVRLKFGSARSEWLQPILLSFGSHVDVVEPPELKRQLRSTIEKMLRHHSDPHTAPYEESS